MAKNVRLLELLCSTSKSLFIISLDATAVPFIRWFLKAMGRRM